MLTVPQCSGVILTLWASRRVQSDISVGK